MSVLDREAIMAALYQRLVDQLPEIVFSTRRHDLFIETDSEPAMLVMTGDAVGDSGRGRPTVWRITAHVRIYLRCYDGEVNPEARLNAFSGQVEAALLRAPDEACGWDPDTQHTSLGGLVHSCQVQRVSLNQGAETGDGIADIEIAIVATQG